MAKSEKQVKKSSAKQKKALQKRMRKWLLRIAVFMLLFAFLAFMTVVLFSPPKVV